jgi:hypothetical protein
MRPGLGYSTLYWANIQKKESSSYEKPKIHEEPQSSESADASVREEPEIASEEGPQEVQPSNLDVKNVTIENTMENSIIKFNKASSTWIREKGVIDERRSAK